MIGSCGERGRLSGTPRPPWKVDRSDVRLDFADLGKAVVIHTETDGSSRGRDRITALAMIRHDFGRFSGAMGEMKGEALMVRLNPAPGEEAGKPDRVGGKRRRFADMARRIREFVGDRPVVGHNVRFHKEFLAAELARAGAEPIRDNAAHCTMGRGARMLKAGEMHKQSRQVLKCLDLGDVPVDTLDFANTVLLVAAWYHALDIGRLRMRDRFFEILADGYIDTSSYVVKWPLHAYEDDDDYYDRLAYGRWSPKSAGRGNLYYSSVHPPVGSQKIDLRPVAQSRDRKSLPGCYRDRAQFPPAPRGWGWLF